jgi:hypothetical protein
VIVVGRYINGVILNPLEYLLDDAGKVMSFPDKQEARSFLMKKGLSKKDCDGFVFEEIEMVFQELEPE